VDTEPLNRPFVMRVSKAHHYLIVFQKIIGKARIQFVPVHVYVKHFLHLLNLI